MWVCVCVLVCGWMRWRGGRGDAGCMWLHQPQWWMRIPGFHSRIAGPLKGNRWRSTEGAREGGAIVINAADAAFCSASGQCFHFQKSPPNSLQIPAGLQNPFKSHSNFFYFPLFLDHHLFLIPVMGNLPQPLPLLHLKYFISSPIICFFAQLSVFPAPRNLCVILLPTPLPLLHTFAQFSRPAACVCCSHSAGKTGLL